MGLCGTNVGFGGEGKTEYLEENLSEQERELTNSAHLSGKSNLHHECSHHYAIPGFGQVTQVYVNLDLSNL